MNEEKNRYSVYITSHYQKIIIFACSPEDAIKQVQKNYAWGDPIDIEFNAEKNELPQQEEEESEK